MRRRCSPIGNPDARAIASAIAFAPPSSAAGAGAKEPSLPPKAFRAPTDDEIRRIVGRVMQETHGTADPIRVQEIVAEAGAEEPSDGCDLIERLERVEGDDEATHYYRNPDGPEAADRLRACEGAMRMAMGQLHEAATEKRANRFWTASQARDRGANLPLRDAVSRGRAGCGRAPAAAEERQRRLVLEAPRAVRAVAPGGDLRWVMARLIDGRRNSPIRWRLRPEQGEFFAA